jgi:hypothetical protein
VYKNGFYYMPVQFGGNGAINILFENFSLTFPTVAADGGAMVHVDPGTLGVYIDARSGDTVKLKSGLLTSKSKIAFNFLSTASSGATYDFTGLSVVNADVVLRAVHTFSGMSFTNCTSFTQNGAVMQNCTFTNCTISSASPGDADNISDCSFVSSGTGHAIQISGTAADMTLDGVTFTGYASSSGSTGNEAIYVNIASGTMTINITGGGSTPSIRTAGATVTVQNAVTVKVTVKDVNTGAAIENARVLVEKVSDGTDILTGLTNSSGIVQTSWAYPGDTAVTGKVRRATSGYGTLYKSSPISGTITSTGLDVTILLIPDE